LAAEASGTCRLCGQAALDAGGRAEIALRRCPACAFVSGYPAEAVEAEQRYAGYYAKSEPPPPLHRYAEWLDRLEGAVGRGRLLEVGAGRGALARLAVERGWKVDATEVSTTGLEHLGATGARVFAGDLESAGYETAAFDAVLSIEVIEHVPRPGRHLAEIARVTRPGGRLLLTTPNLRGLSGRWFGTRWRVIHPEHLGYFTPSTLRAALRQAGFADVSVRTRSLDVTSWRPARGEAMAFDPHAAAATRDRVEGSLLSRTAKTLVNAGLALTGLGDTLFVWARR
jgi:SAM-dependent methyltransferase